MAKNASINIDQEYLFLATVLGINTLAKANDRILRDPIREASVELATTLAIKELKGGSC